MYYVNEFNKPGTDEWQYVIWKIKKFSKSPILNEYKWIKKIYDPINRFEAGDTLDYFASSLVIKNERKVIQRIFEGIK